MCCRLLPAANAASRIFVPALRRGRRGFAFGKSCRYGCDERSLRSPKGGWEPLKSLKGLTEISMEDERMGGPRNSLGQEADDASA